MLEKLGIKVEVLTNSAAKFKAAGTPGTSLNDDQRGYLKDRLEKAFDVFRGAVSAARPGIQADAMQGQVFYSDDAKKQGLIDRIGDFDFAVSVCRKRCAK
jgi:ClpP class serine protease